MAQNPSAIPSADRRASLRTLLTLAGPVMVEQLLTTLFQYVDTGMVGQLGAAATASVSATTTVTWLVNSIPYALGIAVLSLAAQAYGARDHDLLRKISSHAFVIACLIGAVLSGASLLLAGPIPVWMGIEKVSQADASLYFFITSLPMVLRALTIVMGSLLRSVKDTRTPMLISIVANVANVGLDWLLIYGLNMGVLGAALATTASYSLGGLLVTVAALRHGLLRFGRDDLGVDRGLLARMTKVGMPVLGANVTSCLGYVVFAALVASMGNVTFAAHSIAVSVEELFYLPGYGLRTATSTLVGIAVGERNTEELWRVTRMSVVITVGMMCVSGVALWISAPLLMSLFTSDPAVAALGAWVLRIVAFSEPFYGLMVTVEGIFYGTGRTSYPFAVETLSMWCVRIVFTWLCVHLWGLGLDAVWYCMIADNLVKAAAFAVPLASRSLRSRMILPAELNE